VSSSPAFYTHIIFENILRSFSVLTICNVVTKEYEDKNDNLPKFESETYYVGIPFDAKVGDLVLDAK